MPDSNQKAFISIQKDLEYQPVRTVFEAQEDEVKFLEFPDGGVEVWPQVLGSFFCLMNTW